MRRLLASILLLVTLATPGYAAEQCSNPKCVCSPCDCDPCKCDDTVTNLQCPNGKCERQPVADGITFETADERDLSPDYYVASVRLSHKRGGGSATAIDCYKNSDGEWVAILMGCYHVVDDKIENFTAEFFWPKSLKGPCEVIEVDRVNDLALMVTKVPEKIMYIPLTRDGSPPIGSRVCTIGCPSVDKNGVPDARGKKQGDPVGFFTNVTGVGHIKRTGSPRYFVNYPAIGGHSGGGVFMKGQHRGVLVMRVPSESGVVPAEKCLALYEKVFCEGDLTGVNTGTSEDSCFLRDLFRRRQPKTPYESPGTINIRPEPPPTPVVEPPPPPVVEEVDDTVNPLVAGLAIGIPAGLGAVLIMFVRKVKATR